MVLLESELPHGLRSLVRTLVRIKTVIVVIALPILPITFFLVVLFRYVLETDLFAYE
jgi:TRAP-type transport system small permease protein